MQHPLVHDALQRAVRDPQRLAYYLDAYGLDELCRRLDCDEETALLLHLAATPPAHEWLRSIRSISSALPVDPARLSVLLAEAIREQRCVAGDGG